MKTIERALIVVTLVLLMAKVIYRNVDGLLFITLSMLTVYYFWFGFYLLNNLTFRHILRRSTYFQVSKVRIVGSIGASIFLSILVLGILFRLIEYNENASLITFGLISAAGVIIVSLVNYHIRKNQFFLDIVFKFAHWGMLGLIIHVLHY